MDPHRTTLDAMSLVEDDVSWSVRNKVADAVIVSRYAIVVGQKDVRVSGNYGAWPAMDRYVWGYFHTLPRVLPPCLKRRDGGDHKQAADVSPCSMEGMSSKRNRRLACPRNGEVSTMREAKDRSEIIQLKCPQLTPEAAFAQLPCQCRGQFPRGRLLDGQLPGPPVSCQALQMFSEPGLYYKLFPKEAPDLPDAR